MSRPAPRKTEPTFYGPANLNRSYNNVWRRSSGDAGSWSTGTSGEAGGSGDPMPEAAEPAAPRTPRAVDSGSRSEDWERTASVDDVFEMDGSRTLTRHRSVQKREDGTYEVDDSVPKEMRDMLRLLEIEHKGPQNVQQPWSIKTRENGQLEVFGEVPGHIQDQITFMNKCNLRWSPAPVRPSQRAGQQESPDPP